MSECEEFLEKLGEITRAYGVCLSGTLRICDLDHTIIKTTLRKEDVLDCGMGVKDRGGPFLVCEIERKEEENNVVEFSTSPMVSSDYEGYTCPVTDKWVEGRSAHRENLKKHGCRVLEKGEKEHNDRARQEASDKQIDAILERGIDKSLSNLGMR